MGNRFLRKNKSRKNRQVKGSSSKKDFPNEFPFWARLKISKNRTTLVIDVDEVLNKKTNKVEDGFVHREATSQYHKGLEIVIPNPDKDKRPHPMYLKNPRKIPKRLVKPHNKDLEMPSDLKNRYDKKNHRYR